MLELNKIYNMDCLEGMKLIDDNSIDSIVTDPPYGLISIQKRFGKANSAPAQYGKDGAFARLSKGFMGQEWDGTGIQYNVELWKEALRVLKPGGHLLAFGGTRTYHRMACAIEDAGFEIRDQMQWIYGSGFPKSMDISKAIDKKLGAERVVTALQKTRDLSRHNGEVKGDMLVGKSRGSAIIEQKDNPATTEAKQWDGWGTALKPANEPIVVARKPISEKAVAENVMKWGTGGLNIDGCRIESRFPANIILDEEAGRMLDEQQEGASRFFYCAKASKKERGEGNIHPTVKPLKLISYLITLVTPPNGICLDIFEGSGTHALACIENGFKYIGFELNKHYCDIANKRINNK
jgi:DNA modification methylase